MNIDWATVTPWFIFFFHSLLICGCVWDHYLVATTRFQSSFSCQTDKLTFDFKRLWYKAEFTVNSITARCQGVCKTTSSPYLIQTSHYNQISLIWSNLSKAHCSRSLLVCIFFGEKIGFLLITQAIIALMILQWTSKLNMATEACKVLWCISWMNMLGHQLLVRLATVYNFFSCFFTVSSRLFYMTL